MWDPYFKQFWCWRNWVKKSTNKKPLYKAINFNNKCTMMELFYKNVFWTTRVGWLWRFACCKHCLSLKQQCKHKIYWQSWRLISYILSTRVKIAISLVKRIKPLLKVSSSFWMGSDEKVFVVIGAGSNKKLQTKNVLFRFSSDFT